VAYANASHVYSHCFSLIKPASEFDSSTCPSLAEVNIWLTGGCAVINARLAGHGYSAIPATSAAYDLAVAANALYASWMAERSRISARVSAEERTRADLFKRDFEYHMEALLGLDLSRAGVTQTSVAYAGGISKSDVATVESNTDRVRPRFKRSLFANPESERSGDYSSAS
jgi:hypothetical protein